jgi:hypothetical protein
MNKQLIQKFGVDSGLLNYIDNETPRRYFMSSWGTEEDLELFAEMMIQECIKACPHEDGRRAIRNRMGVE